MVVRQLWYFKVSREVFLRVLKYNIPLFISVMKNIGSQRPNCLDFQMTLRGIAAIRQFILLNDTTLV